MEKLGPQAGPQSRKSLVLTACKESYSPCLVESPLSSLSMWHTHVLILQTIIAWKSSSKQNIKKVIEACAHHIFLPPLLKDTTTHVQAMNRQLVDHTMVQSLHHIYSIDINHNASLGRDTYAWEKYWLLSHAKVKRAKLKKGEYQQSLPRFLY